MCCHIPCSMSHMLSYSLQHVTRVAILPAAFHMCYHTPCSISHVLSYSLQHFTCVVVLHAGGIKCVPCALAGKGLWKLVPVFPRILPYVLFSIVDFALSFHHNKSHPLSTKICCGLGVFLGNHKNRGWSWIPPNIKYFASIS